MKKSTIKLVAMLLTVVLMLPNFAGAGALNENEVNPKASIDQESLSLTSFYEMIEPWTESNGDISYPAKYGGCYLDESTKLAIKIVDNDLALRTSIETSISNTDTFYFVDTDISYNDLTSIYQGIPQTLSDKYTVHQFSMIQKDSCIEVTIAPKEYAQTICSITTLSTIDPHIRLVPHIESVQTKEQVQADTAKSHETNLIATANSAIAGDVFYLSTEDGSIDSSATATLGYFGTYKFDGMNDSSCLLIAGHSGLYNKTNKCGIAMQVSGRKETIAPWGNFQSNESYYTGYIDGAPGYDYKAEGDYAFVKYDESKIDPSDKIRINNSSTITMSGFVGTKPVVENQTVYKGKGISGQTTGKVKSAVAGVGRPTNDWTLEDSFDKKLCYIFGLVAVENTGSGSFSISGDSGCPVYVKSPVNALCGIICGSNSSGISMFTPMSTIRAAGFAPYPYN